MGIADLSRKGRGIPPFFRCQNMKFERIDSKEFAQMSSGILPSFPQPKQRREQNKISGTQPKGERDSRRSFPTKTKGSSEFS